MTRLVGVIRALVSARKRYHRQVLAVTRYDPLGPNPTVPSALAWLEKHSEKARWQAAILLYRKSRRWPEWPYHFALAVVDSVLNIHEASFLVRPPIGWEENPKEALPTGVAPELVHTSGLAPDQAVVILNDILGDLSACCSSGLARFKDLRTIRVGSGVSPTWSLADAWCGDLGESLQILLNNSVRVNFICPMPTEGSLQDRAHAWAETYVTAAIAHRLLTKAIRTPHLVSEAVWSTWRAGSGGEWPVKSP